MSDNKQIIAQVKQSYDLADYLRASGVELSSGSGGTWKARCPFHNEKTPSFTVNDHFQNYKCFGCGASGDILAYVMETENYTFYEALKKLAEEKGISIELDGDKAGIDYESLHKILLLTATFYCKKFDALPDNHVAKREILDRKLTFDNTRKEKVKYGYSPDGNQVYKMLSAKGFSDELILQSGVCRKSDKNGSIYDFFRSRLMFIFTDRSGKPVGFSSRKLYEDDTRGKYVNSSDSPLFHKNRVLYNHSLARVSAGKEKNIFICEGQFDVAAFVEAGMPNAVASSGTAFSQEHIAECNKLATTSGHLTFCFDGDDAGVKAAMKVFSSFPEVHENSSVVLFPRGQDPCDYRMEHGDEKFREFVKGGQSMVEFVLEQTLKSYDMDSVMDRAKYLQEAARVAKTMGNSLMRDSAIKSIALESFTSIDVVRDAVAQAKPYNGEPRRGNGVERENSEGEEHGETIDGEAVSEEEQVDEVENLINLMEQDRYYNLCARFISLGLTKKKWRDSLVRSATILPTALRPFVSELEKLGDTEKVFPELFENERLGAYFTSKDFSPFYKLMSPKELLEQFIYLHGEIERENQRRIDHRVSSHIVQVLSGENASVEILAKALEQEKVLKERLEKRAQEG